MKRAIRFALVLVPAGLVLGGVAFSFFPRAIQQPIAFNHLLHVEEVGLECTDCHLYAISGSRATIPNIQVCADCHEEAQTDSEAEVLLVRHVQDGEPIPWRKIFRVPDHVFFSHRRHTAMAELDCNICHGAMGERELPPARPPLNLSMEWCMECHEETGISNDCLLCHR